MVELWKIGAGAGAVFGFLFGTFLMAPNLLGIQQRQRIYMRHMF